jgi:hypothetical protein
LLAQNVLAVGGMTTRPSATTWTLTPPRRSNGLLHRLHNKGIALRRLHDRERRRLRAELARAPGLTALLMKPRNGRWWTSTERESLRAQLASKRRLGLYIAIMLIPGTAITLPLLAWWLDRRHRRRRIRIQDPLGTAPPSVSARTSPALRFPPEHR